MHCHLAGKDKRSTSGERPMRTVPNLVANNPELCRLPNEFLTNHIVEPIRSLMITRKLENLYRMETKFLVYEEWCLVFVTGEAISVPIILILPPTACLRGVTYRHKKVTELRNFAKIITTCK